MLDLVTRIQRRADYLDRTLPKAESRISREEEAFTSWLRSLSNDEAEAFFRFCERELFPPDGVVPSKEGLPPFQMTEEKELLFHYANMDFWQRWREESRKGGSTL